MKKNDIDNSLNVFPWKLIKSWLERLRINIRSIVLYCLGDSANIYVLDAIVRHF